MNIRKLLNQSDRGSSRRYPRGLYLPVILIASTLFFALAVAIVSLSLSQIKIAKNHEDQVSAMEVAEAGINYYLWHLAHDNEDYCDGEECTGEGPYGPYTHNYTDQDGNTLGTYELTITPPEVAGNSVTVRSVGKVEGRNLDRVIIATLGIPSFTKYALFVNDDELWVGSDEAVEGAVHINNSGVRMDGTVTGDISSTEIQYHSNMSTFPQTCSSLFPDLSGDCPGIWSTNESAIFGGAKIFPVPVADFNQVDINISETRTQVRDFGEGQYIGTSSRNRGYHAVLKPNEFDLYEVTSYEGRNPTRWDILSETFVDTYPYPESGVIFVEDNLWIEGTITDQKLTFFAADPDELNPNKQKGIFIPNSLTYTYYDGTDKIGLVTQKNILVTQDAPTNLEINAAMIARYGEIKIEQYNQVKDHIKVYGSMAHNTGIIWTYAYASGTVVSGYRETELIIDESNVLNPPPMFPTTGSYAVLSWREE